MIYAQDINKTTTDEKTGKTMLTGLTTREAFKDTAFAGWFEDEYANYEPDITVVDSLNWQITNLKMLVVYGTWCSDSRREVPRLLKILDLSMFPAEKLTLIAVDRKKQAEGFDAASKDIQLVPTVIVYSGDKELGRIIETPGETLEKDIFKILSAK